MQVWIKLVMLYYIYNVRAYMRRDAESEIYVTCPLLHMS